MPAFLCARAATASSPLPAAAAVPAVAPSEGTAVTALEMRSAKDLSSLLHSSRMHAAKSARVRLFALACASLPGDDDGYDDSGGAVATRMLHIFFGSAASMVTTLFTTPRVFMMLTREAADDARIHSQPTLVASAAATAAAAASAGELPPVTIAWGAVAEAVDAAGLPAYLADLVIAHAERVSTKVTVANVDDPRAMETEEVFSLLSTAWARTRAVRRKMLHEHFDAYDPDADGLLTVAQFWGCLQALLRPLIAAGGEHEQAAEPWVERGEAELLYVQVRSLTRSPRIATPP